MAETLEMRLTHKPVVPLVVPVDPDTTIRVTRALVAGGLDVVEVVLRTDAAIECLAAAVKAVPEAIVGAGTVLSSEQARAAVKAGARFIVSPGLDTGVVEVSRSGGLPVFPGVATASEAQSAWNLGLRAVKFFPASLAGGIPMLKALGSVFRGLRFMPTGGISADNLADYLAVPNVLACGGSWLTPAADIDAGRYDSVTELARQAIAVAHRIRGGS